MPFVIQRTLFSVEWLNETLQEIMQCGEMK